MNGGVLALDGTGQVVATPLRYVYGAQAVLTRCMYRLQTIRGGNPEDATAGLPWGVWGGEPPQLVVIEGQVRAQLRLVQGVADVQEVTAVRVGGDLHIGVSLRVRVDGGATVLYYLGTDASDPRLLGGWWIAIGSGPIIPGGL